jgi:hypothetical protein
MIRSDARDAKQLEYAFRAAADGWNGTRQIAPEMPELLAVSCPPEALELIKALAIPLLVAAARGRELEKTIETVAGAAVVFAPFGEAPILRTQQGTTPTSVVSCRPNRSDAITPILSAIRQVETAIVEKGTWPIQTVVALTEGEVELGYGSLLQNDVDGSTPLLTATYDASLGGRGLASELERKALEPTLLVALSSEVDWLGVFGALDEAIAASQKAAPFYLLTDRVNVASFDLLSGRDSLSKRVLFLDDHPEERNRAVHERFEALLRSIESIDATMAGPKYMYDCVQVAALAAMAGQVRYAVPPRRLTPPAVLGGLRALSNGETVLPLVPEALSDGYAALTARVASDGLVRLVGASGDLDFSNLPTSGEALSGVGAYIAPSARTAEFFCRAATKRQYCATGRLVSQTGTLSGDSECPCGALP